MSKKVIILLVLAAVVVFLWFNNQQTPADATQAAQAPGPPADPQQAAAQIAAENGLKPGGNKLTDLGTGIQKQPGTATQGTHTGMAITGQPINKTVVKHNYSGIGVGFGNN